MSFVSGNVAGSFGDGLSKLMGQFANGGSTIQYLMIKIETLLQRLVATIAVIMYSMTSLLQGVLAIQQDEGLFNMVDTLLNANPFG